jgi:hypothetical protein
MNINLMTGAQVAYAHVIEKYFLCWSSERVSEPDKMTPQITLCAHYNIYIHVYAGEDGTK